MNNSVLRKVRNLLNPFDLLTISCKSVFHDKRTQQKSSYRQNLTENKPFLQSDYNGTFFMGIYASIVVILCELY